MPTANMIWDGMILGSDIESQRTNIAKPNSISTNVAFTFLLSFHSLILIWSKNFPSLFKHMTWNEKSHVSRMNERKKLLECEIDSHISKPQGREENFLIFFAIPSSSWSRVKSFVWRVTSWEVENKYSLLSTQQWIQSIDFLMNEQRIQEVNRLRTFLSSDIHHRIELRRSRVCIFKVLFMFQCSQSKISSNFYTEE